MIADSQRARTLGLGGGKVTLPVETAADITRAVIGAGKYSKRLILRGGRGPMEKELKDFESELGPDESPALVRP